MPVIQQLSSQHHTWEGLVWDDNGAAPPEVVALVHLARAHYSAEPATRWTHRWTHSSGLTADDLGHLRLTAGDWGYLQQVLEKLV